MRKTILAAALAFATGLGFVAMGAPQAPDSYSGGVKGTVIIRGTKEPVQGAVLNVYSGAELVASVKSDEVGQFKVDNLKNGMYVVVIEASEYLQNTVNVTVNDGYVKNMFNVSLTPTQSMENMEDASLMEFDLDDSGYNDSPAIIGGSNDIFNNIASFGFSAVRFKTRGYLSESQDVYLAGVKMNDAITGYSPYSLWSGLNEATRIKEATIGNEISEYGFSGYNGSSNIFANATNVRKGFRASALTNSQFYRLRLMLSYASGMQDNGWAYAFNVSGRFGGNDWIRGVYYRSFAYYAAAEKVFDDTHKLGFVFFGTPGERGKQMGATQEAYDLVGDNMYNPNWGYQNGVVRNSRVAKTHEPVAIVKYDYTPSDEFQASVTALYRFGRNGNTALDWYDAADPRPDYYHNLPSYFYNADPDLNRQNTGKYAWATEIWTHPDDYPQYTQVNWDRLYDVNRLSLDEDGNMRSKYVIQERRVDQNDFNLAATARYKINHFLSLNGGLSAKVNRTEYYTRIDDLLGGEYFININNFAERDFGADPIAVQNDLDYYYAHGNTAQKVKKGDKYGYDYFANVQNYEGWVNAKYALGNLSANVAGKVGYNTFWREGVWKNGLFPDDSQGESEHKSFLTYGAKAGVNYVIGGNTRLYANVGYYNDAPKFNQAFLSPRTRNSIAPNLTTVKTFSADLNASYSANGYNVRGTLFYTTINDQTDLMSFYDDLQNAFTNFSMVGIDERHAGVELGFKVPVPVPGLSVQGALSMGEYIYTSNPYMTQTVDNSSEMVMENQPVSYWKNNPLYSSDGAGGYVEEITGTEKHYVPSTPQTAASLGLSWNKNYWFIDLDVQHFRNAYLDMNPFYRTDVATAGPDNKVTPNEIMGLTRQEKFDPCWLLNLSVGKSWYIHYKYQLGVNFNAKNLLNNTTVKTGGYEQTRLIDNTTSKTRFYRFDSKYFYMSGFNYMLNVYFKF